MDNYDFSIYGPQANRVQQLYKKPLKVILLQLEGTANIIDQARYLEVSRPTIIRWRNFYGLPKRNQKAMDRKLIEAKSGLTLPKKEKGGENEKGK